MHQNCTSLFLHLRQFFQERKRNFQQYHCLKFLFELPVVILLKLNKLRQTTEKITFIFLPHITFPEFPLKNKKTRLHICTKKMYKDHLLSVLIMSWWNKYAPVYEFMNFYFFSTFEFVVRAKTTMMWQTTKKKMF